MRFHNHFYGFSTMFIILVAIQECCSHMMMTDAFEVVSECGKSDVFVSTSPQ